MSSDEDAISNRDKQPAKADGAPGSHAGSTGAQAEPTTVAEADSAGSDWFTKFVAAGGALAMTSILCRHIRSLGWMSVVLCAGTLLAVSVVIVSGLVNFDSRLLTFPPNAFHLDRAFAAGLGASMTIAVYDYLGYYNVCHLGEEVRDPARVIPRSVILSIAIVASIYLTMNISIIAVVPWQQAIGSKNVADLFMTQLYGKQVAVLFTGLILWAASAGLFALLLGYSRIPYAAARNGDFFRIFAYVHPTGRYPLVSLLALGGLTAACCFIGLEALIEATVTVRIVVPFISQIVALHVLRKSRPEVAMPFRMWLYPLPSIVALTGWVFVLATSNTISLAISAGVLASGCLAFFGWRLANLYRGTNVDSA
jgi:amino acid transporter